MHTKNRLLAAALLVLLPAGLAACGDDAPVARPRTTLPLNPNAGGPASDDVGTVLFSLEHTDAVFIEGFDIGIRFSDGDGNVLQTVDWNDYVASLGTTDVDAYYSSTLTQPLPPGAVIVESTLSISPGGAVPPPDLEGPMPCKLNVDLPAGGEVAVEMALTTERGCLRIAG